MYLIEQSFYKLVINDSMGIIHMFTTQINVRAEKILRNQFSSNDDFEMVY